MAKKKKLSLKPVQRGFATTSTPKRIESPPPDNETGSDVDHKPGLGAQSLNQEAQKSGVNAAAPNGTLPVATKKDSENDSEAKLLEDWETSDPVKSAEEAVYQGYIERLQEKGDKEVNKILKAIDFDKRTSKGFTYLDLEEAAIRQIEALREERRQAALNKMNAAAVLVATEPQTSVDLDPVSKEKLLLRLYVTYRVLTRYGFPHERVMECMTALKEEEEMLEGSRTASTSNGWGWEDAMIWLYRHSSEDDLRAVRD